MPDLGALDLLVSVAELGSLGAAARRHGISQPAASLRITALERRLRLRLLDRGPTGSALTEDGHAVVDRARPVLDAAAGFLDGVVALRDVDKPRLHIASSKTIADHRIPQWLEALRRSSPEVTVTLEVDNSLHVAELVRTGGADLGFVEGPHAPRDLGGRVLGADDLVVVVAPTHRWARRRRPLTLLELAGTSLLWRESGSGTRDTVWETLRPYGPVAAPAAELGSAAAILAAARSGTAPAVLSGLIAAPDLRTGALHAVELADPAALTRKFRAVWRRASPPSGAADLLVRYALRLEHRP